MTPVGDQGAYDDMPIGLADSLRRIERRQVQDEGRRASDHVDPPSGSTPWPAWGQLVLGVLVVMVSVVVAWSALNTRIAVVESKIDDLKQQIGRLRQ